MTLLFTESLVVGGATGFFAGLLGVGGGFIMARAWRLWPVLVWLVFSNMCVREVSIPLSL
jgi:uncharacterized membrane protein YfcA